MRFLGVALIACGGIVLAWASLRAAQEPRVPLNGAPADPDRLGVAAVAEQVAWTPATEGIENASRQLADGLAKDSQSISAPDEASQRTLSRAARDGIVPLDLKLPSGAAWARFVQVWDSASEPVLAAKSTWQKLGKSIAHARFAAGQCEEFLFDESQRVNGGFSTDGITRQRHTDEWVSLRMLYREGGGQRFQVVRVMPGELPKLDEATIELRLAERLRHDAVAQLLSELRTNK